MIKTHVDSNEFELFIDLGCVVVPDDYSHPIQLTKFGAQADLRLWHRCLRIKDDNFFYPTRVMKPGEKFQVRAFKQMVPRLMTSNRRLAFLRTKKAILVGTQGLSLVFDQKRDELPKRYWYSSLDKKDHLRTARSRNSFAPVFYSLPDGSFSLDLFDFDAFWYTDHILLCFNESN